jgi:hypothetical protein
LKNQLAINISYVSNFIPNIHSKNYSLASKDANKIQIKNLFLFVFLLKHTYAYNNTKIDSSIFVKPKKNKSIVVLRAPYRYKLARLNLTFSRHYIGVFIKINNTSLKQNFLEYTNLNLKDQIKFLKTMSVLFDTNMLYQHKSKISFYSTFKSNFVLKKFLN